MDISKKKFIEHSIVSYSGSESYNEGSWSKANTPSSMARTMFYYVQSMGHFFCNSNYYVNRSNYDTMLLLYTISGKGELKYHDKSYELTKGCIFIIDCIDYQYYATSDDVNLWETLWIHFNGAESRNYVKQILTNSGPVQILPEYSNIPALMHRIHDLYENFDITVDIKASCIIVEILTELLLNSINRDMEKHLIPDSVRKIINIMETQYNQQLNLDMLVKNIGISKYHFSRLFKKSTGYSPYEYLLTVRLNKAKDLLKTTDLSVYDISAKVGFDDVSHFIKLFRQKEDTTPLKFRRFWK